MRGQLTKLPTERQKLLDAYDASAVPIDLLESEQDRLTRKTAQLEALIADGQDDHERVEKFPLQAPRIG